MVRFGFSLTGFAMTMAMVPALMLALQPNQAAFAAETLSFGVLIAPPYGIEREDRSVGGYIHDVGELIAEKTGIGFTYRLEPLPRLISDMKAGKLDLLIMFPADDTRPYALAELMTNDTIVIPALASPIHRYDDLKGRTIAGLRGGIYDQRFTADTDIKKYEIDSYIMGLRMTMGGRVDGVIGPDFGLYYQMRLHGVKRDELGAPLVLNTRMLHLLRSNAVAPELAARIKAAVEDLRGSGAIAAAAGKYVN